MATIFEMIINGEIPSSKLYEDDICLVILDINPIHKGHSLVISKKPYPTIDECPLEELNHMFSIVKKVNLKLKEKLSCDGSNILINNGRASGQEVPHLHIHDIPRYNDDKQTFGFTKEKYADGQMEEYKQLLSI